MKKRFFIASLVLGVAGTMFAQGYRDGIDFYKIGDYENAKTLFERNVAANSGEYNYYMGMIALEENDMASAKSYFDKGASVEPSYAFNIVGQGLIALKSGDKKAAEELFKAARKVGKKSPKVETAIARAYYAVDPVGNDKAIRKCLAEARKGKNSNDPDSYIFEADMFAAQKDWGNAMGYYEMATGLDPTATDAYVKFANAYFYSNQELAIMKLKEILAEHPNSVLVQREMAEKIYMMGRFDEAAEHYGKYIRSTTNHFPKDEARYSLLLNNAGKYQESYNMAAQLKKSVDSSNWYYQVAMRLMMYNLVKMERYEEAVNVGTEMFALHPTDIISYYSDQDYLDYAAALEKLNRSEEAIEAYGHAVEIDPSNISLLRNVIKKFTEAGNYDKAIQFGQKMLEMEAHNTNDLIAMSDIYTAMCKDESIENKQECYDKGKAYIDKALAENPNDILYLYKLVALDRSMEEKNTGKALNSMQRLANAISGLDEETKVNYVDYLSYAYNYIGMHYYNQKDYKKAYDAFLIVKQCDPNDETTDRILEILQKSIK